MQLSEERIDALIKRLYQKKSYLLFTLFGPGYLMCNPEQKVTKGRECVQRIFEGRHIIKEDAVSRALRDFFTQDIHLATSKKDLVIYLIHHDAELRTLAENKIKELNANKQSP